MNNYAGYKPTARMRDLVNDNGALLLVMARFGISLGFGDKSVREVCRIHHVDVNTFLEVVNFVSDREYHYESVYLPSLIGYLKQAHEYFLDFNLPNIRRKLIESIDCSGSSDIAMLIVKFYDEYVNEVRAHMGYENEVVFKYVNALLQGEDTGRYNIGVFVARHNQIETKLTELKNIIVKYYPSRANNNLLNTVLFDIYSCEKDLCSHCRVEDYMFVPLIAELEKKVQENAGR